MVKEILVRSFNLLLCILLAVILGASMFVTPKYSTTSPSTNARIENSATLADLPVSQADTWSEHTWGGPNNYIIGYNVWTDGTNYYYSQGTIQLVLDTSTNTWSTKTWTGLTNFNGRDVWSDGTNCYYDVQGTGHYILDTSTNTWSSVSWSGISSAFNGRDVWTNGTGYYLSVSGHYTLGLNLSTHTGFTIPTSPTTMNGRNVWTDGSNYYYNDSTSSYLINTANLSVSTITWTGLSNFLGQNIWSLDNTYYYSSGADQYVLDISTNTLSTITWTLPDSSISLYGYDIFTVGDIAYYAHSVFSGNTLQSNSQWYYNVSTNTPSTITLPRLDFEYPQNKLVHSNALSSDSYISFVSLQPLIQNDTLSFTTDSFLDFRYGTSGQRAREFVSIEFVVGQSTVSSIALTSLSTVTDLQFSHFRGDYNISTFTVGSFSGVQLISFGVTMNNVTNFQPTNLNIGVTDLPTTTYPYGAKRNNIMYSDSNGNMVVMYIYYIEGTSNSNIGVSNLYMPESSYSLVDTGSADYDAGYSAGYDKGFTAGETSGYDTGYGKGYSNGDSDGYNRGFREGDNAGFNRGRSTGEQIGRSIGYNEGLEAANSYTFLALVSATIDAPIQAFMGLFNFYVFGIHISDFILGLITLSIALIILRVALKGGK